MGGRLMQIGEVSERTGLSLRTIRHYEEVGVVAPSERSAGGFRLYTEAEVRRLALARRMRPLGFCLEDVRAVLDVLEQLPDGGRPLPETDEQVHDELVTRLRSYWVEADARCEHLRRQLASAEDFAQSLHGYLARLMEADEAGREAAR
ncbi:MerR family transcriptional regulator [Streptomyces anthocyanicus]|uniref:MerR family transcriptional regulator n=1 Tax=Streptomyces anthocyanicus TaxID=68174 RepID=UPI0016777DEA|nr:MerR family transcriptional regulator [Streptomyces cellulosae]